MVNRIVPVQHTKTGIYDMNINGSITLSKPSVIPITQKMPVANKDDFAKLLGIFIALDVCF